MVTKNIYVSDGDLPLFERAAEFAGSMSTAVASGLRLYVAQQERERKLVEMSTIEVEVQDGPVVTTKRFTGRLLLRFRSQEGVRTRRYHVFVTARGQYAVQTRSDPDWSRLSRTDESDAAWEDPRTWSEGWWEPTERSLHVYPDLEAMERELPAELVAAVRAAAATPAVEDLDI